MTLEQQGAYRNLLDHAWLMDPPCSLPDDDAVLAGLSGAGARWPEMSEIVRRWLTSRRGRLVNEKQLAVYRDAERLRRMKIAAGKEGGRKSAEKRANEAKQRLSSGAAESNPPTPTPTSISPSEREEDSAAPPRRQERSPEGHVWNAAEAMLGGGSTKYLGKLASEYGKPALMRAIGTMVAEQPANPRGYLQTLLANGGTNGTRNGSRSREPATVGASAGDHGGWSDESGA